MACKKPGGKKLVLYVGLFLVASCLCHGIGLSKGTQFDKLRGRSTHGHNRTKNDQLYHGRLLIGKNTLHNERVLASGDSKNQLEDHTDYQADTAWGQSKQPFGQDHGLPKQKQDNAAVEQLLKMEPKVECTGNTMKLQLQGAVSTPGSLLFVDRGSRLSPLPLLKLPPSCGYSVQSTQRELVLVAPYDGCFVSLEEDTYVLPLRWWGLPVKMSCPLMRQSSPNPPMVTCHAEGMVVKTEWTISVDTIKVKLAGDWEPLMIASPKCGFGVVFHPEGVVISARYAPCLQKKDGMYTLELAGDGETKISCPSLSTVQSEPTKNLGKDSNHSKVPSREVFPSSPPINSFEQVTPYGQVHQPFYQYPYFPWPETQPSSKPAHVPQPEAPKGQVQQPFFPKPGSEKVPKLPQPGQPGQVYQQYYPYHFPFYLPPETDNQQVAKPTTSSKQPKPGAPQSQRHHVFPQKTADKPPVAQKPQQPETPQGQVSQFFPPQTIKEMNAAQKPYQPEIHQGQMHYPYYHPPYPQPAHEGKPAKKPAAPQVQPKPEAPKGQIHQLITPQTAEKPIEDPITKQHYVPLGSLFNTHHYPFYMEHVKQKPTAAPKTPRPGGSLGHKQTSAAQKLLQPVANSGKIPQLSPPQTAEKPCVAQKPQWPETHQGHLLYPYHHTFYSQPRPENKPATKPIIPPEQQKPYGPPGQVHQPILPQAAEKPPAAPVPQQPEAPNGQVNQPFAPETPMKPAEVPFPHQPYIPPDQIYPPYHCPFYHQPRPVNTPATKPIVPPEQQKPYGPPGQVHQPILPQAAEKPPAAPVPQQPEAPDGQVNQPFVPQTSWKPAAAPFPHQPYIPPDQIYPPYHCPFYHQPRPVNTPATKPIVPPEQQKPYGPPGQVHQPILPQAAEKPPAAPVPQQPEAPDDQVNQPFVPQTSWKPAAAPVPQQPYFPPNQIHYPIYPQPWPENKPATSGKPSATPEPQEPESPWGQVPQLAPAHPEDVSGKVPQPEPEERPTAPRQPEDPLYPEHRPYYPSHYPYGYPFYFQPGPANQPAAFPKLTTPEGQVSKPDQSSNIKDFGTNDNSQPEMPVQNESEVKSPQQPPVKTVPHESTSPQPDGGSTVYCPQSCPPGMSNCCVQIAFHQHFHHIVPVKATPPVSPGLPFLPSAAYSGFDQSLGYVPSQLWPAEPTASKTSTSVSASSLPLPPGNKQPNQQPSHDNADATKGSHPPKSTNQQLMYPYFVPNSSPSYWPYTTQNNIQQESQHSQLPAHHRVASQPQAVNYDQANTKGQNGQLSTEKLTQPVTTILPSNSKLMNPEEPRYSQVQNERYGTPVFYHQAPIYNNHEVLSHLSQPQSSQESKHQQTSVYSEPKGYVLLQHGPPGREMNTDGVSDTNIMTQSFQKPQHPQNPEPQQEYAQHPQRPEKGLISILPGTVNYMQRPEQPVSAPAAPQYSSLHQEPSFKPNFPGFWKPMATRGSDKRSPQHVPSKAFQ